MKTDLRRPTLRQYLSTGVALALALTGAACIVTTSSSGEPSGACTQIGCGGAFSVEFARNGAWPAGTYRVSVETDGATVDCTTTLPFSGCSEAPACTSTPGFILGLSGCALPASEHKLSGIEFPQTTPSSPPARISVKVYADETLLGEGAYTPTYTTSQPNGPDCGPTCTGAPPVVLTLN
ncbi:hypothetical protein [Chondromyces crocatus]|uniref:Lipoprotein n=1 Tax=Chondromyces crocatus TaxID=52 RepID=A0A0K1EC49_CHOCO|nr:hypothetical protein [Chondromyces crocatus]AKT38461.1 uncharacterized protein CMC5_026080 [Chondromyces crocatus]